MKPVSPSIFEFSQELKQEFGAYRHIWTHVDYSNDERYLFYEYFMGNLLALMKQKSDIPMSARKIILKELALAITHLHEKQWIQLGIMQ